MTEIVIMELLDEEVFGNTVRQYVIAFMIFFLVLLGIKLLQKVAIARLMAFIERTQTKVDNAIVKTVQTIKPPFYWFLAFWAAVQFLEIHGKAATVVDTILIAWVAWQVILALQIFVDYFIQTRLRDYKDRSTEVVSGILSGTSKIVLWTIGILFILSNLGINVTSLIAGLGIGGLAVALALQNVLSDLFSSLAIYFDKPFAPGDFIVDGDISGTVQKVGVKTTRIKSLLGEEVVVPNKDLVSSQIRNFKRMQRRRVDFVNGVTYETPQEKMKRIPDMIKDIIENVDQAEFDRAHFHEFADFSLNFEIIYHVESREFDLYMDIHQHILLGIKEAFEKENIEIAFPTRTVHLISNQQ
jgi:small-conductance mechanosensitive channel